MSLFPELPLWTGTTAQLGSLPVSFPNTSGPRSHLVAKTPVGEPVVVADERYQLAQEIAALRVRVQRIEDYLQQQHDTRPDRRLRRWVIHLWAQVLRKVRRNA